MYTGSWEGFYKTVIRSSEILPFQLIFLGLPCEYPRVSNLRLLFGLPPPHQVASFRVIEHIFTSVLDSQSIVTYISVNKMCHLYR